MGGRHDQITNCFVYAKIDGQGFRIEFDTSKRHLADRITMRLSFLCWALQNVICQFNRVFIWIITVMKRLNCINENETFCLISMGKNNKKKKWIWLTKH